MKFRICKNVDLLRANLFTTTLALLGRIVISGPTHRLEIPKVLENINDYNDAFKIWFHLKNPSDNFMISFTSCFDFRMQILKQLYKKVKYVCQTARSMEQSIFCSYKNIYKSLVTPALPFFSVCLDQSYFQVLTDSTTKVTRMNIIAPFLYNKSFVCITSSLIKEYLWNIGHSPVGENHMATFRYRRYITITSMLFHFEKEPLDFI